MSRPAAPSRPCSEQVGRWKVIRMRVFVAVAVEFRQRLVPQAAARGHEVTATTTRATKLGLLGSLGAKGLVMDG